MTQDLDEEVVVDTEPVVDEEPQEVDEVEVEIPEPDESSIPDKYKGKTTAEIIEMHQNLEHYLGVPADKRLEKMRQDGIVDYTDVEDIDVDESNLPDVDKMLQSSALSNFQMLNESMRLGIEFDGDGFALNYDPKDKEQKKAWDVAVKQAENTVNMMRNVLKPVQTAIGKKGMLNEISQIASGVEGTDIVEVTKTMGGIDPDVWKGYDANTKKFLVENQAKVVAYDKSVNKTTAVAPKPPTEKPLNKDITSGVNNNLLKDTVFNAEFEKQKVIYFDQLQNGGLTEDDITDIVKVSIGARR